LIGGSGIFGFALRFYFFDVYSFGSVKELGVEGLLLIVVIPKMSVFPAYLHETERGERALVRRDLFGKVEGH
jgi:hypothetical protein